MNRHELEIYLELYKRGVYEKIPIGKFPDGEYFYMTSKQVRAVQLLNDSTTTFVGYGGSARCFVGETLVQTSKGHKQIKDIVEGEFVLSYNEKTKKREYKKVIKKFKFCLAKPPKMLIFANNLKCTYEHEFLFNGKWAKAFELGERSLEKNRWNLLHFKHGTFSNFKSLWEWKIKINETSLGWLWLFKNVLSFEWQTKNSKDTSRSCQGVYSEPEKFRNGKPQKFCKNRQPSFKFRVDDFFRKLKTRIRKRTPWQFICSWNRTAPELFKTWRRKWHGYFECCTSIGDKTKVCTEKIHTKNVIRRVWRKRKHDKRCYSTPVLESREITLSEFKNHRYEYLNVPIYDLHVEDNHNYTVTENNIIVHNSGKSLIECFVITFDCLCYENIAWGLARKELTTLKKTVLLTLFNLFEFYGINESDYNYNGSSNKLTFKNKSDIFLIDTAYKPSDPLNTRFGGFELTRSAIDESNETDITVVNKLFERTGWRNNDKHGLKRKQFECFNPAKNHVYSRFYVPFRDLKEVDYKKFIPALPSDNPHPSVKEWIEDIIKTGDTITIERQIYGNFDYDDDPSALVDYAALCDVFTNEHANRTGTKRISADLAMKGRDKFAAAYWEGDVCTVAIYANNMGGKEIENALKELKTIKGVGNSNIIADADGLGNYLESYIKNIFDFRGGNTNFVGNDKFKNLKSACGFKLAEKINNRELLIICNKEVEEQIKKEISICLKQSNLDDDIGKKAIISKDVMKEKMGGESPDLLDMLLMGYALEFRKKKQGGIKGVM